MWPALKKEDSSNILPDIQLKGDKALVRTARITDYPAWLEVRKHNEQRLRFYEPAWMKDALSEDYFIRRLKRQAQDWHDDRAYCFAVFTTTGHRMIGGMNLNHIQRGAAQHASLGYWIDERFEGQGYMREAGRLVIEYAFDVLKLQRINAATLPENDRSKKLLLALGFEEEGFAKAYLQINGHRQDHVLFGLNAKN